MKYTIAQARALASLSQKEMAKRLGVCEKPTSTTRSIERFSDGYGVQILKNHRNRNGSDNFLIKMYRKSVVKGCDTMNQPSERTQKAMIDFSCERPFRVF